MIPFPTAFFAGLSLILFVVWDAFETIILPRRVTRRFRFTRLFSKNTWRLWKLAARLIPSKKTRESLLGLFGPISLLILLGVWALGLIFSFGLMHYGAGSAVNVAGPGPGFVAGLYLSGTTFFTLRLRDAFPRSSLARALTVTEAGGGFWFLPLLICY